MKLLLRVLISMSLIGTSSALGQSAAPAAPVEPSQTNLSRAGSYGRSTSGLRNLMGAFQSSTGSVFVVPAAESSLKDLLTANEDMTVMARIFSRALKNANLGGHDNNPFASSLGGPFAGQGTPMAPNVYLEGYGALFTLSVDFPLAPGAKDEQPAPQANQAEADPLWQQTRDDIFEPQRSKRQGDTFEQRVQEYSAERVESLKTTLIAVLKHAANIRTLGPEELVVVTVSGAIVRGQLQSIESVPGSDEFKFIDGQGRTGLIKANHLVDMQPSAPTILMIRAKASDIIAFARGELNLEQFRQRVRVLAYPHLGQMMNSDLTTSITIGRRRR
jgi:hypothetical protein